MTVKVIRADLAESDYPRVQYLDWPSVDLSRFPLVRKAALGARPTLTPRISWPFSETQKATNYTQILRFPFAHDKDGLNKGLALAAMFTEMEWIIRNGVPVEGTLAWGQLCGGYLHYLGREPIASDTIRLRPLRDPMLLKHREAHGDPRQDEWLAEFSLEVTPAPPL